LTGTPADGPVLAGALSLAKAFEGHVEALFLRPDPRATIAAFEDGVYPGFYDEMATVMEREWTEAANKALKQFEKWRVANNIRSAQAPDGGVGPTAEWRETTGPEVEQIGRVGRVSDIIVTALPSRRLESRYDLGFEVALLDTGRPVLLIPTASHAAFTEGTALIAWNGSAEAARAVAAAMPILIRSEQVLVFTAAEGDVERGLADELVTYLKWHGVRASSLPPDTGKAPVEETLLATVKKTKASLLVMGAYTHSRLRELIFGGVTRHVLSHATIPVLMAH
jgi:nucleotide-binding universal stress UspA family protein